MAASPEKESERHDTANRARRRWLLAAGWVIAALLAAAAFVGYLQPELVLDYVNLRYCG